MNSATKSIHSNTEEDYASKKKKVRAHPDDDEEFIKMANSNSKKLKTVSKSKMSTQKKSEVTFSEKVEQINDTEKENSQNPLTPYKAKSPSKASMKSVKEHQKTPFSKIKDNGEDEGEAKVVESASKTNQPNFNKEIMSMSSGKSATKGRSRDVTPKKSTRKAEGKSRSKSPLVKIKEEKNEDLGETSNEKKVDKVTEHTVVEFIEAEEKVSDVSHVSDVPDPVKEEKLGEEENKEKTEEKIPEAEEIKNTEAVEEKFGVSQPQSEKKEENSNLKSEEDKEASNDN